jgi:hypothetical protein
MKVLKPLLRLLIRFRYPVSMPEDVATDLGFDIPSFLPFHEFINCLTNPCSSPSKLTRFMPRDQAENIFRCALRKEKFQNHSLFSYHFKGGWMEFVLHFDEQSRLRRLYIRHKNLKQKHEIRIPNHYS